MKVDVGMWAAKPLDCGTFKLTVAISHGGVFGTFNFFEHVLCDHITMDKHLTVHISILSFKQHFCACSISFDNFLVKPE